MSLRHLLTSGTIGQSGDAQQQADTAISAAEAVIISHLDVQLRLWRQYLRAKTLLLAASLVTDEYLPLLDVPYTHDEATLSPSEARQQAQRMLDAIPQQARESFDRYVEQQRTAQQQQAELVARETGNPMPDPDLVYRGLLDRLSVEAKGEHGTVKVPYEDTCYNVVVRPLDELPTDADFAPMADTTEDSRRRWIGIVIIVVALIGFAILLIPRYRTTATTSDDLASDQPLLIGHRPVVPLAIHTLSVGDQVWHVAPGSQGADGWTIPDLVEGGYLADQVLPLQVCVAANEQGMALFTPGQTIVVHDADGGQRHYTITPPPTSEQSVSDIVLTPCDRYSPEVRATFATYIAPSIAPLQSSRTVTEGVTIQPRLVTVRSPETDTSVPSETLAVDLTLAIRGMQAMELLSLMPRIRWADDTTTPVTGDAQARTGGVVKLTFLTTIANDGQPFVFELTPTQTEPLRWNGQLPAAPTHADQLGLVHIQIQEVRLTTPAANSAATTVSITLRLNNPTDIQVPLRQPDILVTQDQIVLPITIAATDLAAHEEVTHTFTLQTLDDTTPLLLTIGQQQWLIPITHDS